VEGLLQEKEGKKMEAEELIRILIHGN